MTAEFNSSYWQSYILMGYKYILYQNHKDHAVLIPMKFQYEPICDTDIVQYQIPITDEQVLQMASGKVDLIPDFKFYINVL